MTDCGFTRALLLVAIPLVSAADWPAWRGPEGTGISRETDLPDRWSATANVCWNIPLHGAGVSAPIVSGERIFLTASEGRQNDHLHVYCYHRADGHTLWHAQFFGSAQPEGLFPPGGMAVPTPVTDGKHLVALFGTGDLVCLDMDGKPVWMRSLAEEYGPFRNRWGMAASPILVGDLLVVQVDHWGQSYLLGMHVPTGRNRWKTAREVSVNWTSPLAVRVQGKTQLITAGTYRVHSYDAENGQELWTVRGLREQCIPTPVVEGEILYAVSGRKGDTLAIWLDGARGDLTATHILWKNSRGAPNIASPLCYGGQYYTVDDDGLGTCLDPATGTRLWQERLGGHYRASPVAGDGKVYFTNMEGVVTVLQAGPRFQVLAKNPIGESLVASPAIAGGQIFLRGENHLYCIGEPKQP